MHADAPPAEPGPPPDAALWRALGWQPEPRQLQQFHQLQQLLRAWNQRLNLTRLVEGDDYWIAQVFDSLWPLLPLLRAGQEDSDPAGHPGSRPAGDGPEGGTGSTATALAGSGPNPLSGTAPNPAPMSGTDTTTGPGPETTAESSATPAASAGNTAGNTADSTANSHPGAAPPAGAGLKVIDIGTGGGFPGLAVAIALPGAHITLVDSVQRKLDAVAAMAAELGLADRVRVLGERVERTGHRPDCRGRFQLAMARAVAAAPVVAEYLVPLLAPEGQALLYRGQWSPQDQQDLERALALLRARVARSEQRELPGGRGLRTALSVVPSAACPGTYPRAIGVPAKLPLGQIAPAGGSAPPRSPGRAARRRRG